MRSNQQEHIDKVTFIEYTKLPGIINDRLHVMFSENHNKKMLSTSNSPITPLSQGEKGSPKKNLEQKKKEEYVTEKSFIRHFTTVFMGDLDQKMRFTFQM